MKGYALIELLVVIVIIAVVRNMLLKFFNRSLPWI